MTQIPQILQNTWQQYRVLLTCSPRACLDTCMLPLSSGLSHDTCHHWTMFSRKQELDSTRLLIVFRSYFSARQTSRIPNGITARLSSQRVHKHAQGAVQTQVVYKQELVHPAYSIPENARHSTK